MLPHFDFSAISLLSGYYSYHGLRDYILRQLSMSLTFHFFSHSFGASNTKFIGIPWKQWSFPDSDSGPLHLLVPHPGAPFAHTCMPCCFTLFRDLPDYHLNRWCPLMTLSKIAWVEVENSRFWLKYHKILRID